jgi:hypothetical protein
MHDQLKQMCPPSEITHDLPFLEAIGTQRLVCQRTNTVIDGACYVFHNGEATTVIDAQLADLYLNGPLRKTTVIQTPKDDARKIVQRLSLYSGGRFESLSYFKTGPAFGLRTMSEPNTTDEETDPLALIAPKDLPSLAPPALTRNAAGTVVVYLGQTKAVPPAKYVS